MFSFAFALIAIQVLTRGVDAGSVSREGGVMQVILIPPQSCI